VLLAPKPLKLARHHVHAPLGRAPVLFGLRHRPTQLLQHLALLLFLLLRQLLGRLLESAVDYATALGLLILIEFLTYARQILLALIELALLAPGVALHLLDLAQQLLLLALAPLLLALVRLQRLFALPSRFVQL